LFWLSLSTSRASSFGFLAGGFRANIRVMKITSVLRWIICVGIGLLLLMPLVGPPIAGGGLYFPFITGKAFYFRVLVELIFGAWVILALFDKSVRPKFSWTAVAVVAFVVVPLGGVLLGANTSDSIWSNFERMMGWISVVHLGALFFAAAHTLKPKQWWWVLYGSVAVSVITGIIGLAEVTSTNRIDATLGNPIYLAMYSVWHVFLAGYFFLRRLKKRIKKKASVFFDWLLYIFTGIGIFNLIVMWQTGTRSAVLGLFAGIFVVALATAMFQRGRPVVRSVAAVGVVLPVIAVGLFLGFRDSSVVENTPVLDRFSNITLQYGGASARLDMWQVGMEGYAKNTQTKLVGWGMGNYNYAFNQFYQPSLYGDSKEWIDRAHNVLIEWLVAAGPFGVLAYLSLFGATVYLIWGRPQRRERFSVLEKSVLTGLLAAYLTQNLLAFDNNVSYLLIVLFLAWLHARSSRDKGWVSGISWSQPARMWAATAVGLCITALVLAWNYSGIVQAQKIHSAVTAVSESKHKQALADFQKAIAKDAMGTQEAREELIRSAKAVVKDRGQNSKTARKYRQVAEYNILRQINQEPKSARARSFYGDLLTYYGDFTRAAQQFGIASKMTDHKKQHLLIDEGKAWQAAGQTDKALSAYQRAYKLASEYDDDLAMHYAQTLIHNDKLEQSDQVLKSHFGTTTVARPELIKTYETAGHAERTIPLLKKRVKRIQKDKRSRKKRAQAYVSLSAGYYKSGNTEKAVSVLQEVQEKFPEITDQIQGVIEQIKAGKPINDTQSF